LARQSGVPLIFDVDYRPYSWSSSQAAMKAFSRAAVLCDIIIGNDDEFGFMAGDYKSGLQKARSLLSEKAKIVVYKMGAKGAVTLTASASFQTGIYPAKALKPTGAGDAFMGGFLTGLATQKPLRDAVLRGSASASIVVARVGCAPAMPTGAELDQFLAMNPEPAEIS
jgi:5-dehydro-2-deoxygluconokinase